MLNESMMKCLIPSSRSSRAPARGERKQGLSEVIPSPCRSVGQKLYFYFPLSNIVFPAPIPSATGGGDGGLFLIARLERCQERGEWRIDFSSIKSDISSFFFLPSNKRLHIHHGVGVTVTASTGNGAGDTNFLSLPSSRSAN